MAISRLFVEMGKDVDRLNASLRASITAAEAAGVSVTQSGQRILASFDKALNPTKDLAEAVTLLGKAGKTNAEIWAVYGTQMKAAADATAKNGQVVDPVIAKQIELGKAAEKSKISFEGLGNSILDFARNPVQAAQSAISSIASSVGPVAVGMLAAATAIGVTAKALWDLGVKGADEAEALENLSIATGLRTQELQALTQIAKEAGMEGVDFGRIIGKLNEQLGSREGGDFTKALVANGIALEDSSGKAKSAITLLDELRLKFIDIEDPVQRAQAMQAALGGRLRDLIPLLMAGNEGLAAQIKTLEDSGPVWDDITQKKLLQFDKALDTMGRSWTGVVTDIKSGVGSMLGDLAELVDKGIPKWREYWAATKAPTRDYAAMSDEDRDKLIASAPATGILAPPTPPKDVKKYDPAAQAREIFEAQQKLIAQGADYIDLRMKIAEEQKRFDNLINKGTNEQLANQAKILRGLNEELKLKGELEKLSIAKTQAITESQMTAKEDFAEMIRKIPTSWDPETAMRENLDRAQYLLEETIAKINAEAANKNPFDDIDKVMKDVFAGGEKPGEEEFTRKWEDAMDAYADYLSTTYEAQLAQFETFYEQIDLLRQADLISEQEASDAKKDIAAQENLFKLEKARTFFGTLASIQSSHIRAIAAIGKAAAIVEATINTYVGATEALRQGGVWGMLQMGAVLAAGFAQVASIASQGFKGGGYTGAMPEDRVAGVVHGREFVVNAEATKSNLPLLEAINAGREVGVQMDSGPSMGVMGRPTLNVSIANYGTAKQFEVERVDESTVRIIARDEALSVLSRRGPEIIANDLSDANSRTSKAIARHTTARRGDR
jgi:hypothetical protein